VPGLVRIGSRTGGWVVPEQRLGVGSICYCAGVGEDITFDLGLIERFGCEVWAFDPTPRAVAHVATQASGLHRYHFQPVGLWDRDETCRFYAPSDPAHVSHSVVNLQRTEQYFEAPCRRLSRMMAENGHDRLDLLKLDIEGAEYRVVQSLIEDDLDVRVLCVEFDEAFHALDGAYRGRIRAALSQLADASFRLVHAGYGGNYTLIHERGPERRATPGRPVGPG
jgi:FkbM family methyltransferase